MSTRSRILFVDDDPQVLDWLQRLLQSIHTPWEPNFLGNAADALVFMERFPVDVLVTDMLMPGMTGAELLRTTAERHPGVARLVLAAPSEQPLVMPCATLTHQFIVRPCEAEVLRDAISRALELDQSIRRERISALLGRMDCMPSVPDLYLELVEKIQDPECCVDDIGRVIARDISMTARILKLVNSAYFGLRRRVSNPYEAVSYVGIDMVRALVLSISAFAQFEHVVLGGVVLDALWNHSLLTAGRARIIALSEGVTAREVDDAFVSGLLHDVGKLALSANFPAAYNQLCASVDGRSLCPLDAEACAFGANHAEIGGHLLALWGLPHAVVDAVAWHHNPAGCPRQEFGPLACVHAANVWSQDGSAFDAPKLAHDYYAKIGRQQRIAAWRRASMETDDRAST